MTTSTTRFDFPETIDHDILMYFYSEINETTVPGDVEEFWRKGLLSYCLHFKRVHFSLEEIQSAFTSRGMIPMSITSIIEKFQKDSTIFDQEKLQDPELSNDSGLLTSLFTSLLSFGSSMLSSQSDPIERFKGKRFVNCMIFDDMYRCLLKFIGENGDYQTLNGILTVEASPGFQHSLPSVLVQAISHSYPSDQNWQNLIQGFQEYNLLISYWQNQHKLVRIDDKTIQLTDFSSASSITARSSSSNKKSSKLSGPVASPVSDEVALAKFRMQLSLYQVSHQIDTLQAKVQDYLQQALKAKKLGNETLALFKLKLKKNVMETQKKLLQAQYNLEEALHSLESSQLNVTVLNAYQIATHGLKTNREVNQLTESSAEDIMEEFQNEMEELNSIDEVLNQYQSQQFSAEDEEALARELDELMKETPPEEKVPSLPTVPSHSVTTTMIEQPPETVKEREKALVI